MSEDTTKTDAGRADAPVPPAQPSVPAASGLPASTAAMSAAKPDEAGASGAAAAGTFAATASESPESAASSPSPKSASPAAGEKLPQPAQPPFWHNAWLWVAIVALALSAWQWVETRLRLADTQQELARRLADSDSASKENRLVTKQVQDQVISLQSAIGAMESKLADSQSQQASLENLYQDLARSRDEWALSEIEQSVTLAAQQLQLAGNVHGAVLALQAADARLAGSSRPQFITLRKAFARDLDRLKALPQVDLPGMSLRLENVIAAIDTLPLAIDVRPQDTGRKAEAPAAAPLRLDLESAKRLAQDMWREFRDLVRIQRFDREEPVLLAPGQVFFLRENLKLRLLNARLALLSHDQWIFRAELKAAQVLMERHFDTHQPAVQTALNGLKQLTTTELSIELPTLNESLSAIRSFKLAREKESTRETARDAARDARK